MSRFRNQHNWNEFRWENEIRSDERRINRYFAELASCLDLPGEEEIIAGLISETQGLVPAAASGSAELFRPWSYLANIKKANDIFHTNLFRPPHGWIGLVQYRVLRYCGLKVVMWDVVTRDYSRLLTADDVVNNVKRYTRNGSIITMHDSLKSIDKLKHALPEILVWLKQEGYEFGIIE